jgi:hypothetical protein
VLSNSKFSYNLGFSRASTLGQTLIEAILINSFN